MQKLILFFGFVIASFTLHAADSTFLQYKGTYIFPYGSMITTVEITIDDSVLMISSSIGTSRLDKIANDSFYLVAYDGVVVFIRDSTKTKVSGIKIEAQSVLLEGEKQADKSSGAKLFYKKEELVFINKNRIKKHI